MAFSKIAAENLGGSALPAISGASLTTLNATNISSGTLNAARYSGGKILQVVGNKAAVSHSTTSTTWVDSGMKVDITPSATSSKILIIMNSSLGYMDSSSVNYYHWHTIYRDVSGGSATNLATGGTGGGGFGGSYRHTVSFNDIGYEFGSNYLDSPNTTSAIEYKLYHRVGNSGWTGYVGIDGEHHMTAMEIGA